MENIQNNKLNLFQKFNLKVDVKKSADILGTDEIKIKDLFSQKSQINKMSDIFPNSDDDKNKGFLA